MSKLDAKDLELMGAIVAEANVFLLGRADGEILMDSKTIETLECICMGLTIHGDTMIKNDIFTKQHLAEAGREKLMLLKGGSSIEDLIFAALSKNKDKIIAKIRSFSKRANLVELEEIINEISKEARREAHKN